MMILHLRQNAAESAYNVPNVLNIMIEFRNNLPATVAAE